MTTPFVNEPAIKVVDMDSHYTEPPDLWTSRAPEAYRDLVPKVVKTASGAQRWMVSEGIDFGPPGYTVVKEDGTKVKGSTSLSDFAAMSRAAYDPVERVRFLEDHGIYQQIMFPNVAGFGTQRFLDIKDHKLRELCATIYNDAMVEIQGGSNNRLFPQALVPFWDDELAISELYRVRKLGLTGIAMCDTPELFGLPTLDAPYWERFWSVCEELDFAVNFHIGSGGAELSRWSTMSRGAMISALSLTLFLNNASVLSNLIFSGVLLRHPRLKIISVESGIGWVPFLLEGMEYQFDENMSEQEKQPWGDLRPRDLFRRNCYVSFWFEDFGPRKMIPIIGEDNVMFETDFPHPTCLYPKSREHVATVLSELPYELRKKVLRDTAVRVYNLPD